jgi:hypothetical protein
MTINDRAEEFKAAMDTLKQQDTRSNRDQLWVRLGVALIFAGIVVALVAFFLSQATDNPLNQSDDVILGFVAVTVSLAGLALFLRYSISQFLRFWLTRLIFEQQGVRGGQTDPKESESS